MTTPPPNNDELIRALERWTEQHGKDFAALTAIVQDWQRRQVAGERFATETRRMTDATQHTTAAHSWIIWSVVAIVGVIVLILVIATIASIVRS